MRISFYMHIYFFFFHFGLFVLLLTQNWTRSTSTVLIWMWQKRVKLLACMQSKMDVQRIRLIEIEGKKRSNEQCKHELMMKLSPKCPKRKVFTSTEYMNIKLKIEQSGRQSATERETKPDRTEWEKESKTGYTFDGNFVIRAIKEF